LTVSNQSGRLVPVIGAFRLVKAVALVALGLAGLLGVAHQTIEGAERAVMWLGLFPGHAALHRALVRLDHMDDAKAARFGIAALAYAAVFTVEGTGLLLRKRWAEWLTVIVTSSFIPIEVYEMVEHFSAGKAILLALNVAIVIYLVARRLEERGSLRGRLSRAAGRATGASAS
jgi:uncharacterized membrane protein (DUF2068 family)